MGVVPGTGGCGLKDWWVWSQGLVGVVPGTGGCGPRDWWV